MSEICPRVSVGIPVRNGQNFIRETLDSLLGQVFGHLEVVVCDNCSTDATEEICREYARRDPRVRYFRNERDLGPAGNHVRCFDQSRGEYFRWNAHDDVCAPRYLEATVALLDSDPTIANAHCLSRVIDECGNPIHDYSFRIPTDSQSVSTRFGRLINVKHRDHTGYEVFGLMRREQMAQVPPQGAYPHGDRLFMIRMCLRGRFVEVPEYLFFPRRHASQSMQLKVARSKYLAFLGTGPRPPAEWWDPSKKGKIVFPEWKFLAESWKSVGEVPLSLRDNLRCRLAVGTWVLRNLARLGRDVAFAIESAITRRAEPLDECPRPATLPADQRR